MKNLREGSAKKKKGGGSKAKVNIFIALFGITHSKRRHGEGQRSFAATSKNAASLRESQMKLLQVGNEVDIL